MNNVSDRLLSSQVLQQILQHKGSLSSILSFKQNHYSEDNNPALIQAYCYGACRHFYTLEYICSTVLEKPLRKKDADVYCLILLGLYELLYMRTPDHAAINETVNDTKRLKKPWAKGLVNAVLREAQRNNEALQTKINQDFKLKFAHADWLISSFKRNWPKHYQEILTANNKQAPMTIRLNLSKASREDYLITLADASIPAKPGVLTKTAIVLEQPVPVQSLPGFNTGLVSVQDEASQLASSLLQLNPGQRVLDACAAPGGKTCAILEAEPALAELIALDNEPKRLTRVEENLLRTGLQANLICSDINDTKQWWSGHLFDRILLDVPCSGTGVIRRHPDIKLLRQENDIAELNHKQISILNTVWPLLAKGGLLVYSTCSTLLEENSHIIETFIKDTNNVIHLPIAASWGLECNFGRQLLPGTQNQDGFYYALLQKC